MRELLGHVTVLVFLLLPFFRAAPGTVGALPTSTPAPIHFFRSSLSIPSRLFPFVL
jgi:hypothetical protein